MDEFRTRVLALLRDIEWAATSPPHDIPSCPSCFGETPAHHGDGHAVDCDLAKLLGELIGLTVVDQVVGTLTGAGAREVKPK